MALTAQQLRELSVELAKATGLESMSKTDLIAAATALDTFLGNNQTAINNAFPEPFKTNATTPQQAALLSYVALRRWAG